MTSALGGKKWVPGQAGGCSVRVSEERGTASGYGDNIDSLHVGEGCWFLQDGYNLPWEI